MWHCSCFERSVLRRILDMLVKGKQTSKTCSQILKLPKLGLSSDAKGGAAHHCEQLLLQEKPVRPCRGFSARNFAARMAERASLSSFYIETLGGILQVDQKTSPSISENSNEREFDGNFLSNRELTSLHKFVIESPLGSSLTIAFALQVPKAPNKFSSSTLSMQMRRIPSCLDN